MEGLDSSQTHNRNVFDERGRSYEREEINAHWARYRFFDEDGDLVREVAFPRVPIISDEVIAAGDAEDLVSGAVWPQ